MDKSPAAKIDGDVFYRVAVKYNLPTDIDSMNLIVNLVNQGLSPDDAGKVLASGGMMTKTSPSQGGLLYMDYQNPSKALSPLYNISNYGK